VAALLGILVAGASVRPSLVTTVCDEPGCHARPAAAAETLRPALPDCCSVVPEDGEHLQALPPAAGRAAAVVAVELAVPSDVTPPASPVVRVDARPARAPPPLYASHMARLL
jgi:hypothetical protein